MRRPGRARGSSGGGRPPHSGEWHEGGASAPSVARQQRPRPQTSSQHERSRSPPRNSSRSSRSEDSTPPCDLPISRSWRAQPRVAGPHCPATNASGARPTSQARTWTGHRDEDANAAPPRMAICSHCGLAVGSGPVCPIAGRPRTESPRWPAQTSPALAIARESETLVLTGDVIGWESHTRLLYMDGNVTTIAPRHYLGAL